MSELISTKCVKARQEHECNYCGETIHIGEAYRRSFLKCAGDAYTWKSHIHCQEIADELYDYIDPSDWGVTEDEFCDACNSFCRTFICPSCTSWSKEYKECEEDQCYCIDKIHNLLQTHHLERSINNSLLCFKLVKNNSHTNI